MLSNKTVFLHNGAQNLRKQGEDTSPDVTKTLDMQQTNKSDKINQLLQTEQWIKYNREAWHMGAWP